MRTLSPHYEYKLLRSGFEYVAGADEVGRGALAGPLVAAVVVFDQEGILRFRRIAECPVRDSKCLSRAQRERIAPLIKKYAHEVVVSQVSPREIDGRGMGWAAREVFYRALAKCKMQNVKCKILIDAVQLKRSNLPREIGSPDIESIIHGDSKVFSIAAASIVAKVYRDRLMVRFSARYPSYGFDRHVGYGTAAHLAALARYGLCPLHRKTFSRGKLP